MPDASADFVRRLARFFLVGVSATAIHIAALYAFTEFLEVWYVLSSAVAFLMAQLVTSAGIAAESFIAYRIICR